MNASTSRIDPRYDKLISALVQVLLRDLEAESQNGEMPLSSRAAEPPCVPEDDRVVAPCASRVQR